MKRPGHSGRFTYFHPHTLSIPLAADRKVHAQEAHEPIWSLSMRPHMRRASGQHSAPLLSNSHDSTASREAYLLTYPRSSLCQRPISRYIPPALAVGESNDRFIAFQDKGNTLFLRIISSITGPVCFNFSNGQACHFRKFARMRR